MWKNNDSIFDNSNNMRKIGMKEKLFQSSGEQS